MDSFDKLASQYQQFSLVQRKAADRLIEFLEIGKNDSILDIGCGPGHITHELSKLSSNRIVGLDKSAGMIKAAHELYPAIEFWNMDVEHLDLFDEFDIVFCNSAMQWFTKPDLIFKTIYKTLKNNGKMGIASPATDNCSPWLINIISKVSESPEIKPNFSHWKNPWFFLLDSAEYKVFFERLGFTTIFCGINYEETFFTVQEAYNIYLSGAANGFIGTEHYDTLISDEYIATFNNKVKEEIDKTAVDGKVKVDFNRLYYIGKK